MSINDLDRNEFSRGFGGVTHNEIANENRRNSIIKDATNELTIKNSRTPSSHGDAALNVRNHIDDCRVKDLQDKAAADKAYYDNLFDELTGH